MSPLYDASVPVFRHYLGRADALARQTAGVPDLLTKRLAPNMFTAAEQFATAASFAPRICYPLAGRPRPEEPALGLDHDGVRARIRHALALLDALDQAEFDGAESRRVQHRAGFAELDQSGTEYLHLFGLPNFFFHLSMAFAVLRMNGIEIGKADFDGLHDYPPGFSF